MVPVHLTVLDSQKQRGKLVQWQAAPSQQRVFYVVQVRRSASAGHQPHQRRFEPWKTRLRRRRNSLQLADLIPGHWYQFRVATVNANGSRGYSDPSEPFKLNIGESLLFTTHNIIMLPWFCFSSRLHFVSFRLLSLNVHNHITCSQYKSNELIFKGKNTWAKIKILPLKVLPTQISVWPKHFVVLGQR